MRFRSGRSCESWVPLSLRAGRIRGDHRAAVAVFNGRESIFTPHHAVRTRYAVRPDAASISAGRSMHRASQGRALGGGLLFEVVPAQGCSREPVRAQLAGVACSRFDDRIVVYRARSLFGRAPSCSATRGLCGRRRTGCGADRCTRSLLEAPSLVSQPLQSPIRR